MSADSATVCDIVGGHRPPPGVWTSGTAERCWEISQGYAFFAYPWNTSTLWNPHPERVSRTPRTPCRGRDSWCVSIPGVRKKRVPLANLLAPLRGASAVIDRRYSTTSLQCECFLNYDDQVPHNCRSPVR